MLLVEALVEMPSYAKFMKELMTKNRILECEIIEVSHHCSAIVTNNLVAKKDAPCAFIIPYTFGFCKFGKAMCDLGTSINLMPLAIFEELGFNAPSPTTMRLFMADQSI